MNEETLDLSDYARETVSNVNGGRQFFDYGLQLFLSYQHELAAKYFQLFAGLVLFHVRENKRIENYKNINRK